MKKLKWVLILMAWWHVCAVAAFVLSPEPDLILHLFRAALAFVLGIIVFAAGMTVMLIVRRRRSTANPK